MPKFGSALPETQCKTIKKKKRNTWRSAKRAQRCLSSDDNDTDAIVITVKKSIKVQAVAPRMTCCFYVSEKGVPLRSAQDTAAVSSPVV